MIKLCADGIVSLENTGDMVIFIQEPTLYDDIREFIQGSFAITLTRFTQEAFIFFRESWMKTGNASIIPIQYRYKDWVDSCHVIVEYLKSDYIRLKGLGMPAYSIECEFNTLIHGKS